MKPVLLHYHIFKNAGTTIDWILEKNFRNLLRFDDFTNPRATQTPEKLLQFIKGKEFDAITSHQLRFPIPESSIFLFIPLIFIRHPVDRSFSIHAFEKRNQADYYYSNMAKKLDLKGFIQFNLNSEFKAMRNSQTRFLSKQNNLDDLENHDLDIAKMRLEQCNFGVVDMMDKSLVLIENNLKNNFPRVDFSYKKLNISRFGSMQENLEKEEKEVGKELMIQIKNENLYDFELYEFAKKRLLESIQQTPDFDLKLKDFIQRCKKLQ